jgi:hypothetical protein
MAYRLTSADLPVPIGPSVAYLRSSSTDSTTSDPIDNPFATADFAANITKKLNDLLAVITVLGSYPGGVFGVASGLKLYSAYDAAVTYEVGDYASDSGVTYQCILQSVGHAPPNATYWAVTSLLAVDALNVGVSSGVAVSYSSLEFSNDILTLPDDTAIVYVWLKLGEWNPLTESAGTLDFTATTTPPALNSVLLGYCQTASGVIVPGMIGYDGVAGPNGNLWERTTNDIGAPVDAPSNSTLFLTHTQAGAFLWVNDGYQSVGTTQTATTTASTIALTTSDPSTQAITLTADSDVTLPSTPTAFGMIANTTPISDGFALTLKDSTGSYTYAVIQPGYYVTVNLVIDPITGAIGYQPVYIPTNGVTSNSVLDTQSTSGTGVPSLTLNITSDGGPVVVAVAQDTGLPIAYGTVTCDGVTMTGSVTSPGSAQTLKFFYVLSTNPGVLSVVIPLSSGTANMAAFVRSVRSPSSSTATLGATDQDHTTGTSASISLAAAIGDIVLDAICVPTGHTATTNQTADGSPESVGSMVMYAAEAYGNGTSVSMDYTVASSGAFAHAGLTIAL